MPALTLGCCLFAYFVYLTTMASTLYTSKMSFYVKSEHPMDLSTLGVFGLGSQGGADDNQLMKEFMQGRQMAQFLDDSVGLREHYSDLKWDYFSRLDSSASFEDYEKFFRKHIRVYFDYSVGLIHVSVDCFSPAMAKKVSDAMLLKVEEVVNYLGHKPTRDQLIFLE